MTCGSACIRPYGLGIRAICAVRTCALQRGLLELSDACGMYMRACVCLCVFMAGLLAGREGRASATAAGDDGGGGSHSQEDHRQVQSQVCTAGHLLTRWGRPERVWVAFCFGHDCCCRGAAGSCCWWSTGRRIEVWWFSRPDQRNVRTLSNPFPLLWKTCEACFRVFCAALVFFLPFKRYVTLANESNCHTTEKYIISKIYEGSTLFARSVFVASSHLSAT